MCGGFGGGVLSFEKFNFKEMWRKIGHDPERAFIGAGDPASSKVWGKVLNKDYEPVVNQWGGASGDTYDKAEAAGIDTGAGRTMHQIAQTIAQFYAMKWAGGLGGSEGGVGGSMGLSENSPAGTPTTGGSGWGSLFGGGGGASSASTGQWIKMGGQAIQGASALASANANAGALTGDAASERAAAARQAQLTLKNAERVRGAARAATAASGAKVDEFSLMNETEIMRAGEVDASMALLSGERRARALEEAASQQKKAGSMAALTSLFQIGSTMYSNWK